MMPQEQAATQDPRHESASRRVHDVLRSAIERMPTPDVEELAGNLEEIVNEVPVGSPQIPLVRVLAGGRDFNSHERFELETASLLQYFMRRRELLRESLTTREVSRLLNVSRQTPHDRVEKGSLVAVLDHGTLRFPVWQFDSEGPDGVIEGLPGVLRSLQVSPLAKISWLTTPNNALRIHTKDSDITPLAALKSRQIQRVIELARGVGTT
jgi:hypothetical protein